MYFDAKNENSMQAKGIRLLNENKQLIEKKTKKKQRGIR